MRNISMSMTLEQFRNRTKTVTRRMGFKNLKIGDRLNAIEKGMGLKKGEKVNSLGVIKVTNVTREKLSEITDADIKREGFAKMQRSDFIRLLCKTYNITPETEITRIEYEYVVVFDEKSKGYVTKLVCAVLLAIVFAGFVAATLNNCLASNVNAAKPTHQRAP